MRGASAGFALACLLLAAPGRAEGESFAGKVFLDWSAGGGAESCITREKVIVDVEAILERPVFAGRGEADRVLRVDVDGAPPAKVTGQILLSTAGGASLGARELSVQSDDCKDVAAALALALSIMADLPRTPAEGAPKSSITSVPRPVPPPPPAPRWHATVGLGPTGALDSNGDFAPGGQAAVVVVPPRFVPFSLSALSLVRSSSTPAGAGYTLSSTTVAPAVCTPAWSRGSFTTLGCLGPALTVHLGWGAGFTDSRAGLSSTVGGLLQTYAAYSVARSWRVVLGVAAAASPQRVSLAFTDQRNVSTTFYRTPLVAAFVTIGVATDLF
jgi:hypothetical protein